MARSIAQSGGFMNSQRPAKKLNNTEYNFASPFWAGVGRDPKAFWDVLLILWVTWKIPRLDLRWIVGITPLTPSGISQSSPGVGVRILGNDVMLPFELCEGKAFPFVGVACTFFAASSLVSSSSESIELAKWACVMGVLPPDSNETVEEEPIPLST